MTEGSIDMAEKLNNFLEMKDMYGRNDKFTEYVNKVAKGQHKSVEEVLCQATTYEYLKSVLPGGCNFEKG